MQASMEEIKVYKEKAEAWLKTNNRFNDFYTVVKTAIMEYLANQENKTIFDSKI